MPKREGTGSDNPSRSERILTFDLMRGYFLIVIILNHLHRYPNTLDWLTARGILFVSAAEGFFAVSGIILGLVRGAKLRKKPFLQSAKLLWKRGFQLYLWSIMLTVIFTLIGWQYIGAQYLKPDIASPDCNLLDLAWRIVTFQYVYGWADFLRYYALFLFVSPLALYLLRAGMWYGVLFTSILVWALTPFLGWSTEPIKWQILFFAGFTLGYHWYDITAFIAKQTINWRRIATASVVGLGLLTFSLNAALIAAPAVLADHPSTFALSESIVDLRDALEPAFDKPSLAPARLGLFITWFAAALIVVRRLEPFIAKYAGWLLLPFGRNSLYVYIVHAFLIFMLDVLVPQRGIVINAIIAYGSLTFVWLLIRYRILFRVIPR